MKTKSIVKAKKSWSHYDRDLVLGAVQFASEIYNLEEERVEVRFRGDKDAGVTGEMALKVTALNERVFIIWVYPQYSTKGLLETVFHEVTHIKQVVYDGFVNQEVDGIVEWRGQSRKFNEDQDYWQAPWEVEARKMGRKLRKIYTK